MTIERALRLIAGAFVILSVLLGIYVNTNFLWFTLFVGAEPAPVGVHELVPDDGGPAKGRLSRHQSPGHAGHECAIADRRSLDYFFLSAL